MDILIRPNKELLDFSDLVLIFKVTAGEIIHGWGTSVFSENTVTSLNYHDEVILM